MNVHGGIVTSVLVVDDEPAIRKVVASALAQMGCDETFLAEDAESALEIIERQRPDIVISDVKLPAMSGIELAHRVKSSQALGDTPVLLMSAFGEPARHDADGFLAKPFDIDDLAEFIEPYIS
jgi:two-component system response regulator (stage 0 sporulation protein F)